VWCVGRTPCWAAGSPTPWSIPIPSKPPTQQKQCQHIGKTSLESALCKNPHLEDVEPRGGGPVDGVVQQQRVALGAHVLRRRGGPGGGMSIRAGLP
jgi:hypothetical protein